MIENNVENSVQRAAPYLKLLLSSEIFDEHLIENIGVVGLCSKSIAIINDIVNDQPIDYVAEVDFDDEYYFNNLHDQMLPLLQLDSKEFVPVKTNNKISLYTWNDNEISILEKR